MGGQWGEGSEPQACFFAPAGEWDPHQSPACPQEVRRRMTMRVKRRCSVMPARGPTAPPQTSKLGLREDSEQGRRGGQPTR